MFHRRSALLILVLDLNRNVNELKKAKLNLPQCLSEFSLNDWKGSVPDDTKTNSLNFYSNPVSEFEKSNRRRKKYFAFRENSDSAETFVPDIWLKFRRRWPRINSAALLVFSKTSWTLD